MDSIPLKRCRKCGNEYPATTEFFSRKKTGKHGVRAVCKVCCKESQHEYAKRPEAKILMAAAQKRYREKPEVRVHYSALKSTVYASSESYRNKIRANGRKHESTEEYKQRKRDSNKKRYHELGGRERVIKYRATPKGQAVDKVARANRRSRMRSAQTDFKSHDWQTALEYFDGCCAVCGKSPDFWTTIAADHWIPLYEGGSTTRDNMLPLCHAKRGRPMGVSCCNNSKNKRLPEKWLIQRYGKKKAREILDKIELYFYRMRPNG